MRYLSLFSGIEAASVAWGPLRWRPVAFAEIDKWASRVLEHHYPEVRNLGDVNGYREWEIESPDLVVGGSPCQSFSVGGLRGGLEDERGNLALVFCRIVGRYRPRWVIWENVPGVFSIDGGRAFGSILGALAQFGYGFAWRVLDAQYVRVDGFCRAVPQRRRRVFLVGSFGGPTRAGAVLFDTEGRCRNSPPRRRARNEDPTDPAVGAGNGCPAPEQPYPIANTLTARMSKGINTTMDEGQTPVLAFNGRQDPVSGPVAGPLTAQLPQAECVLDTDLRVRRLTPRECERVLGFPDDYTFVPGPNGRPMSDTQRYRMLGNSMAVNVMRWIGMRIAQGAI